MKFFKILLFSSLLLSQSEAQAFTENDATAQLQEAFRNAKKPSAAQLARKWTLKGHSVDPYMWHATRTGNHQGPWYRVTNQDERVPVKFVKAGPLVDLVVYRIYEYAFSQFALTLGERKTMSSEPKQWVIDATDLEAITFKHNRSHSFIKLAIRITEEEDLIIESRYPEARPSMDKPCEYLMEEPAFHSGEYHRYFLRGRTKAISDSSSCAISYWVSEGR